MKKIEKKNNYKKYSNILIVGISLIIILGLLIVGNFFSHDSNSYFARIRVAIKKKVQIVYNQNLFDGNKIDNSGIKEYDSDKQEITFDGKLEGNHINLGTLNVKLKKGERYRVTVNYLSGSYDKNGEPKFVFELQKDNEYYTDRKNGTHYIFEMLPTKKDKPIDKVLTIKDEVVDATNILYRLYQDNEVEFKNYKIQISITKLESKIGVAGEKYGSLPTPEKNGYEFLGWYDSISGGKKITETNTILKKYNHPLYAHWKRSYKEPILPPASDNVIRKGETDSFKVYITDGGSYYLTRIWVKDAYSQFNKQDANPYGIALTRPSELLKNAVSEKKLDNKLLLGFNASGFYLKKADGTGFDVHCVNNNPAVNRTSVGTVLITNGNVIRNAYEKRDKETWFITGINKENKMVIFEDVKKDEINVDDKKAWSEKVIKSGIRNTYTFAASLIENGQQTKWNDNNSRMPGGNNTKKGLQIFGQIDENNYVFFTSRNETRNKAIDLFLKMGCKTAVNLDGGGSVALLFKDKNSNQIETILGNGRSLPEVGYVSE